MTTSRQTPGRGIAATALGGTFGAIVGGLLGYAAAWLFEIPECVRGGFSCGGLGDAYTFGTSTVVGGYAGAVLNAAVALRLLRHRQVARTCAVLVVFLGTGTLAWIGLFLLTGSPLALLGPPLLLPFVAASARIAALGSPTGARSSR